MQELSLRRRRHGVPEWKGRSVELQLGSYEIDDATVVEVGGELDALSAPELDQYMEATVNQKPRVVVLDLSGVDFMDSSGLGICIKSLKRVSDAGGQMLLVVTTPRVMRVLEITGIDQSIPVAPSVDEALTLVTSEEDF